MTRQGGVTLCMILKNARDLLPAALDSVAPLFEQGLFQGVSFVDTGSSDDTLDYLSTYFQDFEGSFSLRSIPWQDDFSAARNAALEAVETPYLFFMDADERLASDSGAAIRYYLDQWECAEDPLPEALVCLRQNLDDSGQVVSWDQLTRLWRTDPAIHYRGRIHERPVYQLEKGAVRPLAVWVCPDIVLRHLADDPAQQQTKAAYYLRLIDAERQTHPSPFLDYHWVISSSVRQRYTPLERFTVLEQAMKETLSQSGHLTSDRLHESALSAPHWAGVPWEASVLEGQYLLLEARQPDRMLRFFEHYRSHLPVFAESWGQTALVHYQRGEVQAAFDCFYEALLTPLGACDPSQGWDDWRVHSLLAGFYLEQKDLPAAWCHWALATERAPVRFLPLQSLAQRLQGLMSRGAVLRLLDRALQGAVSSQDRLAILDLLSLRWVLAWDEHVHRQLQQLHHQLSVQSAFRRFFKALTTK